MKLGATRHVTWVTGEKEPCCSEGCREEFRAAWVGGHPEPVPKPESPFPSYLLDLMSKEVEANNFGLIADNLNAVSDLFNGGTTLGPLEPRNAPDCETLILNHRPDTLAFITGGREWVERIIKEAVG